MGFMRVHVHHPTDGAEDNEACKVDGHEQHCVVLSEAFVQVQHLHETKTDDEDDEQVPIMQLKKEEGDIQTILVIDDP